MCFCQMNLPGSTLQLSLHNCLSSSLVNHLSIYPSLPLCPSLPQSPSLPLSLSLPLSPSIFFIFLSLSLSISLYLSSPVSSYTHTVSLPFFWKPCASASMKCVQKAKCSEKGIALRSSRSAISNTESLWWARGLPLPLLCRKQIVLLWCSIPTFAFQSG